ncbi:MAG: hypothetical protein CSA66_07425 [Proteobacteria bacterium]|nr:MAG: hypothetical protein CSA66_07425 [Pseudomonadota bacterium]
MASGQDPSDPKWVHVREWREPEQLIRVSADAEDRGAVYFSGAGSMAGARALTELLDELRALIGTDKRFVAIVDLRDLAGAPLRAQFHIGKWLFARKRQIERVAVFGGRPFEMRIARAVMKIARMREASFFDSLDDALRWLGWGRTVYP